MSDPVEISLAFLAGYDRGYVDADNGYEEAPIKALTEWSADV